MTEELPLTESAPPPVAVRAVAPAPASIVTSVTERRRTALRWLIDDVLMPCYRALIPSRNVWQWADDGNVFLDAKASPTPGYYASSKTPHTRKFQATFTDPDFDEEHAIKSSRSGFTEAILNIIRFMPGHRPGPALYAIDTAEEGKKVCFTRLRPTLPDGVKTGDEDDITNKLIRLRNMDVHIGGSYSPSLFLNKFLLFTGLDEVDAVDIREGDETIQSQARTRMVGVPGAKLYSISKPRRWRSPHHCEVVTGTLEANLVPCPHCGTFQELSFDGQSPTHKLRIEEGLRPGEPALSPPLGFYDHTQNAYLTPPAPRCGKLRFEHCRDLLGQWDLARIKTETWYECVSGCRIDEREPITPAILGTPRAEFFSAEVHTILASGRTLTTKQAMMLSGRWLQTNPRPHPRKRSRHISDLYTLHEDLSWGDLAEKWIKAQSDPALLMNFINNHLGLPWREHRIEIGQEQLTHCRSPYRRGTLLFIPEFLTLCADTQGDVWKFATVGYRLNGERCIANWGIVGTKAELLDEFNRALPLFGAEELTFKPTGGFVDAGGSEGRTDDVYDLHQESYSREHGNFRLWPVFGRDYRTNTKIVWYTENVFHRLHRLRIFFFADDVFKRRLYHGSIGRSAAIRAAIAEAREQGLNPLEYDAPGAKGLPQLLHYPAVPADKDLAQLQAELLSEQMDNNGVWKKHGPNDYGDCVKLCDVSFEYMLPHLQAQAAQRAADAAKNKAAASAN